MNKRENKIKSVYGYIERYYRDNGFSPSVREICAATGVKSTASAYEYIEALTNKGLLTKSSGKNRSLSPISQKCGYTAAPIVGKVTAGNPILAVENLEGYYPLPTEFGEESFILNVVGDSMIGAGIKSGDRIIVRRQNTAENGDIVVAVTPEDTATVKRFFKRNGKFVLHPENPELKDIVLDEVNISGKVVGLIRKF